MPEQAFYSDLYGFIVPYIVSAVLIAQHVRLRYFAQMKARKSDSHVEKQALTALKWTFPYAV